MAAELNHSQVFASDLEKSQFTMENLKNNFPAQISKVIGKEMAGPDKTYPVAVAKLVVVSVAPSVYKIVPASLPAYFHSNAGS